MKLLALPCGSEIALSVRRSGRARHILLHVGTLDGSVELVLPNRVPLSEGMAFARSKRNWIEQRLAKVQQRVPFEDGMEVPVLGVPHIIQHIPAARGRVRRDGAALVAESRPEHLARRVRDWFCAEARREITARVDDKARRLGQSRGRITIRDQRTRWGSCSYSGNLNFSWRLIMAPEHVLDYVVAHEVAHLRELNHGERFWSLVEGLSDDISGSRQWLAQNGLQLHRYG